MLYRMLLAALIAAGGVGLCAEETETESNWPTMSFTGQLDFATQYNWRGFDVYDDRAALQPSFTFGLPDAFVSFNLWGSFASANREEEAIRNLDEIDFTVAFRPKWWQFEFGIGHISYVYPQVDGHPGDTAEVFTELRFYIPMPIEVLSASVYGFAAYDYDQGQDFYLRFGTDWTYTALSEPVTLSFPFGAWLGYNNGQFNVDSNVSDIDFYAGVQVTWKFLFAKLVGHVTFCPEDTINPDDTELWLIGTLGVTF